MYSSGEGGFGHTGKINDFPKDSFGEDRKLKIILTI